MHFFKRDNKPIVFDIISGPNTLVLLMQMWVNKGVTLMVVCYTAVFSVVTQRSSPLRDGAKNGCVADYPHG